MPRTRVGGFLSSLTTCYTLFYTVFVYHVSYLKIGIKRLKSTLFDDIRCFFLLCQYVFITEQSLDNKKTIHEQLSKYLMTTLKPGADPAVVNDLMKVLHRYKTHIERETEREGEGGGVSRESGGGGEVLLFFPCSFEPGNSPSQ